VDNYDIIYAGTLVKMGLVGAGIVVVVAEYSHDAEGSAFSVYK
jgi:hypothetical protein